MLVRTQDYDEIYHYLRRQRDLGNEFVAYPADGAAVLRDDLEPFATRQEAETFCEAQCGHTKFEYIPVRPAYRAMSEAAIDPSLDILRYGYADVGAMTEARLTRLSTVSESETIKHTVMNNENLSYLENQVKFTGFGEGHAKSIRENMEKNVASFALQHNTNYGKDEMSATLNFRKSDTTDMYFFNNYQAQVKNGNSQDTVSQTFYISNKEQNVTLKEAYNLLEGRAAHKELTNKDGEKYKAWVQLDFKDSDQNGNFKMKKFTENYGFHLDKELEKHPIKELGDITGKERLLQSLERGNRQSVTLNHDGAERKVFVEAAPQFKSLNFYDEKMQRLRPEQLYPQKQEQQGVKEAASQEVKQETKKDQKQAPEDGEGGAGKPAQREKKKKGMSVA
jgi:hypothetical protein